MMTVKLTMIKAVNVNQFRIFILIIKDALQVFQTVIFVKPAHGAPAHLALARRPSPPLVTYDHDFVTVIL